MVVVRESPSAQLSPSKNPTPWPPRSPFQAMISSPSGRKRWTDSRHHRGERSPSPSPRKGDPQNAKILRALSRASDDQENFAETEGEDDDDDEDEETLELKLAEIQAKLKLKRLQKKSKKASDVSDSDNPSRSSVGSRSRGVTRPTYTPGIEVPLSPVREKVETAPLRSPARVRLGLEGVGRAAEVSLKRPKAAGVDHRVKTMTKKEPEKQEPRVSFGAKLVAEQASARDIQAKQERIEKTRSTRFHVSQGANAVHSSRVLEDQSWQSSARLRSPIRAAEREVPTQRPSATPGHPAQASFEAYSELHLSKRHVPHVDVAREMEGREIYTLPRLLKEVTSPHYDPPDCENDFVVFAIVASKTTPYDQKAAHRTSDEHAPQEDVSAPRNKFMVLKLCDLKWEVDCFLFGTAFDQFWKLTPGTLVAILNPGIMPPKTNQHSGRFSLKLGSSEDSVMEIGLARDLAYCASVKSDGKQCEQWIDKRSTDICEFHLNLLVDKQRKGRMEVNNISHGGGDPSARPKSKNLGERGFDKASNRTKQNGQAHGEYGRLYAVPRGIGKSVASLLDEEDTNALLGGEASRKRIAAAEKERNLARKLCELGTGMGAEYLRSTTGHTKSTARENHETQGLDELFAKPKASDLGLLDNKARDIHLSPAKDRKKHFGLGFDHSTTTAGGSTAMGWGGAKKAGLLQPKYSSLKGAERGQTTISTASRPQSSLVRDRSREGSLSPKKRARFALESGIREPGRESMTKSHDVNDGDDDDDDLDIV